VNTSLTGEHSGATLPPACYAAIGLMR